MLKPIRNDVLLKPLENYYQHGNIILTQGKESLSKHEVLAVSDSVKTLKPGDIVFHRNWYGDKYKQHDVDCLLVDVKEVWGVCDENNA